MGIREFSFDDSLSRQFVDLEDAIYCGDDRRIPPMRKRTLHQMSRNGSFVTEPGSARRNFVAFVGRRPVGRVSAFVNPALRDADRMAVGTVGMFECVNDPTVAEELLGAAVDWLAEKGLRCIWGPMNFDIWHGYRLMTSGFDQDIFCGEPYNKTYYPELFERFGFRVLKEWDTVELETGKTLEANMKRAQERYEQVLQQGYQFVPFDMKHYNGEVRRFFDLLRTSFASFLGFTAPNFEEFRATFAMNKPALDPEFFIFCHNSRDQLSGFAVSFMDLSGSVRAMKGRTDLVASLRFLLPRRSSDRIILYLGGVTPEEGEKRSGLGRAALYHIVQGARRRGIPKIVMALMAKGNNVHSLFSHCTGFQRREYALYQYNIGV